MQVYTCVKYAAVAMRNCVYMYRRVYTCKCMFMCPVDCGGTKEFRFSNADSLVYMGTNIQRALHSLGLHTCKFICP